MGRPSWLTARPVAHRGYHDRDAGRIENTIPAVEAAIARGFAIECDLQLTRDDVPIVFHDDTLDRLTEATGPVAARTLARSARPSASRHATPASRRLTNCSPSSPAACPSSPSSRAGSTGTGGWKQVAAPALAAYAGPLAVMSFDPDSVLRAEASSRRRLPRGMVADSFTDAEWKTIPALRRLALRHLAAAPLVAPSFIAYGVHALPADAPLLLRHLGMPLLDLDRAHRSRPGDRRAAMPTRSSSRASTPSGPIPTFAYRCREHSANVGIKRTTSNIKFLVELVNLTFDQRVRRIWRSNVKFAPPAYGQGFGAIGLNSISLRLIANWPRS